MHLVLVKIFHAQSSTPENIYKDMKFIILGDGLVVIKYYSDLIYIHPPRIVGLKVHNILYLEFSMNIVFQQKVKQHE